LSARTIAEVLAHAVQRLEDAGIDDALLESEALAAFALGITRSQLLARFRDAMSPDGARAFEAATQRRLHREPLAYILGQREFYGLELVCRAGVLIPRPETELLVDYVLAFVSRRGGAVRVADVGTGSGAIAVAVAAHAREARVVGVDASREALEVARENVERYGLGDRVELRRGDLLESADTFDVIAANLPYVSESEWPGLAPEVRDWEPRDSLVGGREGTEVNERLLACARDHVGAGGLVVCEMGASHGARLSEVARAFFPEARIQVRTDLAGLDRMLVIET